MTGICLFHVRHHPHPYTLCDTHLATFFAKACVLAPNHLYFFVPLLRTSRHSHLLSPGPHATGGGVTY